MSIIRNILFPVDFSPSCVAMAHFIKRAALLSSAKVSLVHVLEPSTSGFAPLVQPMPEIEKNREQVVREKLDQFLNADFPSEENPRILTSGDPARRIAEIATKEGSDVIALPTHAGIFRRSLLGSTTAKVLDQADCPVLTTQHAETISLRGLQHRELVCAVGLTADSERVIRYASRLAKSIPENLTLVHVIPEGEPAPRGELLLVQRIEAAKREAAKRRIEKLRKAAESNASVEIVVGPTKAALIEAARRLQADVLLIGRSPQAGAFGRLRDLTYAVVRDAPCPVLSV